MSGYCEKNEAGGHCFHHVVAGGENGRTVADILKNSLGFSRSLVRALKREGAVRVNGEPVFLNARVRAGAELAISLPDCGYGAVLPEKMPLEVLLEDEDLLVINKPPGMLVHPLTGEAGGTLANAVVHRWSEQGRTARFRPVYRIDRDTSGLVLVAANPFAYQGLVRQLTGKSMRREYLAVVRGHIHPERGILCFPIGRSEDSIVKRKVKADGKEAITQYRVLERLPGGTIVKCSLETGRTHQIRVHLSHLGHPLYGDTLYGGSSGLIGRQALHAASLVFRHPRTGEMIHLESEFPPDITDLIGRLKSSGK